MKKTKSLPGEDEDSKQLNNKIQQLQTSKKDILYDLEEKSKTMRQTETQLKMKENEMEILNNSHQIASEKLEIYKKKIDKLESEVEELRTRAQRAERDKGKTFNSNKF